MSGHVNSKAHPRGHGSHNGVINIPYARTLDEALRILSREQRPTRTRKVRTVKMPTFNFTND